jgi:hypothetical protein
MWQYDIYVGLYGAWRIVAQILGIATNGKNCRYVLGTYPYYRLYRFGRH